MKTLALSLALALFAVTPTLALAQEAGKAQESKPAETTAAAKPTNVDPEAKKLQTDVKAALKKVRDVSYKLKQTGGMTGSETPFTGVVTLSIVETPGMGLPFDRYKIVINDDKGAPKTEWATDGTTLFKIDHAAKKFFSMKAEKEMLAMPPRDTWDFLPMWLMDDSMQAQMWNTTTLTLGKDAEVGGVKCRAFSSVEEMTLPSSEEGGDAAPAKVINTQVKHVGADDMIPRKVEMNYTSEGMEDGPKMKLVAEMTEVKANVGLKEADFALKAPEGYTSEAGTFENMGLPDPDAKPPELKAEAGKPALAFALKDAKGAEVTLASLKGRVVLLDFWATWCGPCKAAMPSIQKLHEKFAGKDVTVIGVNCWEDKAETAIKYMDNKKYTYTLLLKGDDLAKEYGISGIPTLILIGKDGNVLHAGVGFGPDEEENLGKLIQAELDKK